MTGAKVIKTQKGFVMIEILNKVKALDERKFVLNIFSDTSDEDDYLINLNAQYLITSLLNDEEQKVLYEYIKEHEPINEMSKTGYVLSVDGEWLSYESIVRELDSIFNSEETVKKICDELNKNL